jgi:hypothetical protein
VQAPEEIKKSAEEIVEEFVRLTQHLPPAPEQYYLEESVNVTRRDGEPTPPSEREDFRRRFLSVAPASDEDGSIKAEVAQWAEP